MVDAEFDSDRLSLDSLVLKLSQFPILPITSWISHPVVSDSLWHWIVACQTSLSVEFSRQEYWKGLPFPSPWIFLTRDWTWASRIAGRFFTVWATREALYSLCCCCEVALVVADSVRPHRLPPTRFLCPWDSPDKNTGVGCHFLL